MVRRCRPGFDHRHTLAAAEQVDFDEIGQPFQKCLTLALIHLQAGARVYIMPRFDAEEFLTVIERERVTSVLAVPTMLSMRSRYTG